MVLCHVNITKYESKVYGWPLDTGELHTMDQKQSVPKLDVF